MTAVVERPEVEWPADFRPRRAKGQRKALPKDPTIAEMGKAGFAAPQQVPDEPPPPTPKSLLAPVTCMACDDGNHWICFEPDVPCLCRAENHHENPMGRD